MWHRQALQTKRRISTAFLGVFLVGDPVGIRWGSAGDPRGIRAVNWGIHTFCHARGLGFEGDPVTPLNAFIILKREIRGLRSWGQAMWNLKWKKKILEFYRHGVTDMVLV